MYRTLNIDRQKLTIEGVKVKDLDTLNNVSSAIGTNMFEGFEPTQKGIEIIIQYLDGKLGVADLIKLTKEHVYV